MCCAGVAVYHWQYCIVRVCVVRLCREQAMYANLIIKKGVLGPEVIDG